MKIFSILKQLSAVFFFFAVALVNGQISKFENTEIKVIERLKNDIAVLAADSLLGREAGTKGEIKAYTYIIEKYKEIGLKPILADNSYLQSFTFKGNAIYEEKMTSLKLNNQSFLTESRFFPLKYSASSKVNGELVKVGFGIIAPDLNYNDYKNLKNLKGKIFVMEYSIPEGYNKDSKFIKYADIRQRIDSAIARGASGIIFVNTDNKCENPSKKLPVLLDPTAIPVIFGDSMVEKFIAGKQNVKAEIAVKIFQKEFTAYNVIGFIDNNAPYTIVLGAHYDHLGMGGGNSRIKGKPAVHNGADDNASGTAGIIELARQLLNSGNKKNNYLIIAFSGEEKGLLGSSHFVKSNAYDLKKINYMLNLDMIGRLDSVNNLKIIGTGSSPIWDSIIKKSNNGELLIKTNPSGIGGSDHTSFYLQGIPVLFFCTKLHQDYHTPADDVDKINIKGQYMVLQYVQKLISELDDDGKLVYTKTAGNESDKPTKMTVTLGVMPDFTYQGKGFRIDGVTEGKPGANAGLKAGDIVIQLGDFPIDEIQSYMKALGNFKKGDKVPLIYLRGEEKIKTEVQF